MISSRKIRVVVLLGLATIDVYRPGTISPYLYGEESALPQATLLL